MSRKHIIVKDLILRRLLVELVKKHEKKIDEHFLDDKYIDDVDEYSVFAVDDNGYGFMYGTPISIGEQISFEQMVKGIIKPERKMVQLIELEDGAKIRIWNDETVSINDVKFTIVALETIIDKAKNANK